MMDNPAEKFGKLIGVIEYFLRIIGTAKTVRYTV